VSIMRCDRCGDPIDTDEVGEFLDVGGTVRCARHACIACGERPQQCDDYCVPCEASFLIANPSEYQPNYRPPGSALRMYDLPHWRDAEAKFLAHRAQQEAA
jgi:hypothetical protein